MIDGVYGFCFSTKMNEGNNVLDDHYLSLLISALS